MESVPVFRGSDSNGGRQMSRGHAGFAAATLGGIACASSKGGLPDVPQTVARSHTSFGPLKQIDAGLLNVGYAEAGPADGTPVILLHGWPYDIHSYVDVAPLLAS